MVVLASGVSFLKEGEKRTLSSLIAHFFYEGFLGAIKTNRPCAKKKLAAAEEEEAL